MLIKHFSYADNMNINWLIMTISAYTNSIEAQQTNYVMIVYFFVIFGYGKT